MKKVLSIVAATAMLAIVACGPSAEEKAKLEAQKQADSIANAQRISDSLTQAENQMMDTTAAPMDTTAAPAEEAKH